MNIIITGVYGFLGSNLANFLANKHNVFGLYHKNKNEKLSKQITIFSDVTQVNVQPDVIVMCHAAVVSGTAVLSENELEAGNVSFTQTILNYFSKAKIMYISTVAVYGNYAQLITETTSENPQSDYAVSKLKAEQLLLKNTTPTIIRFSSLYGNGMKENTIIPMYCQQAIQDKRIVVWGDGSRMQNYIHISDAVKLINKIVENDIKVNFPILHKLEAIKKVCLSFSSNS